MGTTKTRERIMFAQSFRGTIGETKVRETEDGRKIGDAEVSFAVYGIPDDAPGVGNESRQIIDHGAFRSWIDATDFDEQPVPFYRDHGDAHLTGHYDSGLLLGWVDGLRETDDQLIGVAHYVLDTDEGRNAFAKARANPKLPQFSFSWIEDVVEPGGDGEFDHVTEFPSGAREFSQVGFGAQERTGIVALRAAIGAHASSTSDGEWDGPANESRLSSDADAATLAKAYAWRDPDGDAETKAAYKFIHHEVGSDGAVGAANVTACRAGIAALNGARGGTVIPDSDRQGVYNHLARHLRDADQEPPELRASATELSRWLEDDEYAEQVRSLVAPVRERRSGEDRRKAGRSPAPADELPSRDGADPDVEWLGRTFREAAEKAGITLSTG